MTLNYKNFSALLLSVIFTYLIVVAAINIVVDPFYVFQTPFFKVQAQINDRYAKIEFLKKARGRFDSYIMGSSRMFHTPPDVIQKYVPGANFYNLATVSGTMYEHFLHVRYFVQHGYPVKNLYIGMDADMYFTVKMHDEKDLLVKLHPDVLDKNPIDFYWSYLDNLPRGDLKRKLRLNFRKRSTPKYEIERDGTLGGGSGTENGRIFFENPIPVAELRIKEDSLSGNLKALRELVTLCGKYHIHLILFINPYHKNLMDHFAEKDYLSFLRELSEIAPFWDFSGYNSITTDNKNYLDHSHYNPSVSRLIAARIFNDPSMPVPEDFGVRVTSQNIKSHLKNLKKSFRDREPGRADQE
jgi:hypothetical protein